MLVQKVKFDLMQSKLDDIRVVQGDSSRQIQFICADIDGEPISPDNYTFTFNLIKPDHTFVIQSLPGDVLTITEQMEAYTGTSYYNLQVKDSNNDIIYSGQGAFIVDDSLITDGDIESVAEVNGYVFPDDFATRGDIDEMVSDLGFAKIDDSHTVDTATWSSDKISDYVHDSLPGVLDDNEIASDSTWSSAKIADELSNINVLDVYSTSEHLVGKWLDGSDVYEVTFYRNISNLNEKWQFYAHDIIPDIDAWTIISAYGMLQFNEGGASYANINYPVLSVSRNGGKWYINLYAGNSICSWGCATATIRYVKKLLGNE